MKCGLCQSPFTTHTTCPDNRLAQVKDYTNHPLSGKRPTHIMFLDQYLARLGKHDIVLSNEPFIWLYDFNDSSISTEDHKFRWDTYETPRIGNPIGNPIILYGVRANPNQTSFEIEPSTRDLCVCGYRLTVNANGVQISEQHFNHIKIYPACPLPLSYTPSAPIKFVSYNILTGHEAYENDFRKHIPANLRTWSLGRNALVKTEVLKADIAVLVECTKAQLRYIVDKTDKFDWYIELKANQSIDGTAILFNKSRFSCVKYKAEQLITGQEQIVFNVALLDHQTNKLLCITGLHLKSGDGIAEEIRRVKEIRSALNKTKHFIADFGNIPQVLSGDLNSDLYKWTSVAQVLTKEERYTNIGNADVSTNATPANNRPTYKFWQESIYDYIFIKGDILAKAYSVDNTFGKICPNKKQGSDHLAIRCDLIL